jgi:adenylylsulfate kinase
MRLSFSGDRVYSETHVRSVAKALTWRVVGTLATSALVFVFTRRIALSLTVGGLEFLSKIGLFWMHERAWDRIRIGRRSVTPSVLWLTGLSGAGKTTIANRVREILEKRGLPVEHLDGDSIRDIFPQTGFSRDERNAHVRRVGYLASRLEKHGVIVVASLISPYEESRRFVRGLCGNYVEIYVATPLEECEKRDPKGLYRRARSGEIDGFTGIDDPYEIPRDPELVIDTAHATIEEAAALIVREIDRTNRKQYGPPARNRGKEHLHPAGSVRELQAAGDALVDRKG